MSSGMVKAISKFYSFILGSCIQATTPNTFTQPTVTTT